jgi:hypothetical protein
MGTKSHTFVTEPMAVAASSWGQSPHAAGTAACEVGGVVWGGPSSRPHEPGSTSGRD